MQELKTIVYFQRKRRPGKNFSLEQIFENLRQNIGNRFTTKLEISPFVSSGIIRRFLNIIVASFTQGDINHVTGDINYVTLLLKKNTTILTILDTGILSRLTGFKRNIIKLFWFTLPVMKSRYITVISEFTKSSLALEVPEALDKTHVIYVPINSAFQFEEKIFNQSKPVILQIGAAQNKNLERLIQAVNGLEVELLIIGELSSQNRNLLDNYNIDFINKVNIGLDELINCYKKSDMLFFASTFEGFGMPILEAQAVGRPVITSNLASMPEVAGGAALLVNPYNTSEIRQAILKLINDESLRKELVTNGLENVKRFKPEEIAKQYMALYSSILKS